MDAAITAIGLLCAAICVVIWTLANNAVRRGYDQDAAEIRRLENLIEQQARELAEADRRAAEAERRERETADALEAAQSRLGQVFTWIGRMFGL